MIDLTNECVIPLAAVPMYAPGRGGKRLCFSTVWRWVLKGSKAPTGELVKLEAVRLGGRWVTSKEALARFSARLTPCVDGGTLATPRTANARQRSGDRAARRVEAVGI